MELIECTLRYAPGGATQGERDNESRFIANMKFEHLVQINDPCDPLITPLSRAQLWRGLLLRAEQPEVFMHGLDNCAILERGEKHLHRELRFGSVIIRDKIELIPEESLVYAIAADNAQPGGRLTIAIEEPAPRQLFVRF